MERPPSDLVLDTLTAFFSQPYAGRSEYVDLYVVIIYITDQFEKTNDLDMYS